MSSESGKSKNAELVLAAKAGSQEAMTELYGMSYNAVYNTVRFLIRDEDTAQDILQDSYIKAFRSLDQLREADSFSAWVKRIAHNRAVDYLRKTTPVSLSSLTVGDGEEEIELEDVRPENLPDVSLDRKETARLLGEILDSLPQEQLACISLFYYDQLSVRAIAEELGIPEATVKSRLQYGRKKIETQVKDLEKKGTKLYGLSPILFLLLLMRSQEAMAAEIPADLAGVVLPEKIASSVSGASGGGAGAGSAAGGGTAAGHVATAGIGAAFRIGSVSGMRLIVAALAGVVLLGTGAALLNRSGMAGSGSVGSETVQEGGGNKPVSPEQRPGPEAIPIPEPPHPPEPEPIPEPEYKPGYLFAANSFEDYYTKELSGDTLYVHLPELTVGLPASWKGKFYIKLAASYSTNEDGTNKEFSNSTAAFYLLPDEYQGEDNPPYIEFPEGCFFQVNCILRDLDSFMESVSDRHDSDHYIPIGSGKLGNYFMILGSGEAPEYRVEGYNWELYDEMYEDLNFIVEHTYVTPMEKDPF